MSKCETAVPEKARADDFVGRFREIISDPINLLIQRVANAGIIEDGLVYLHNGNRVAAQGPRAYYDNFSLILSLNRGVHEPLEEYVFQEMLGHLSSAPVMLELGSYWAHYSMWFKRRFPNGTAFMVEPDQESMESGRFNFETNGFSGNFIQESVGRDGFAVDKFRRDARIPMIDVLHADIQGSELEMLEGAVETLGQRAARYIFVSTHSQALHTEVISTLREQGYRVEISSDFDEQTTSHDGLVFASSPAVAAVLDGFRPLGRAEITQATPKRLLESLAYSEKR